MFIYCLLSLVIYQITNQDWWFGKLTVNISAGNLPNQSIWISIIIPIKIFLDFLMWLGYQNSDNLSSP